jgi:hypothetical protein
MCSGPAGSSEFWIGSIRFNRKSVGKNRPATGVNMTRPRKQQRAMITQCFRLMLSSGVLRPASMDPGLLTRPWTPPPPEAGACS